MTATRIGYARCSTHGQDLAAQREALITLGVAEERICPPSCARRWRGWRTI